MYANQKNNLKRVNYSDKKCTKYMGSLKELYLHLKKSFYRVMCTHEEALILQCLLFIGLNHRPRIYQPLVIIHTDKVAIVTQINNTLPST